MVVGNDTVINEQGKCMKVELLDHMGDDLAVVNAARVSFDKQSAWGKDVYEIPTEDGSDTTVHVSKRLSEKDTKLIYYLVEHEHWSPFSHVIAKFRVTAPIIINHQLWKSHIGAATQDDICGWNGVSRRYVDTPPEFYIPEKWRKRAEDVKQGSSDEAVANFDWYAGHKVKPSWNGPSLSKAINEHHEGSLMLYKVLLANNVCPEQARMVLPQSMMTEWIWTGSLAFWARLYKLRMHETAQEECKPIASAIGEHMNSLFPVSWKALNAKES